MITIPGYTTADKVPGVVAINKWGAGKKSIGAIPLVCTLFGNFGASGTADANTRYELTAPEEADALFEPRSELARMCHAALDVPGVTLRAVGVSPAAGGTAATFTFDITGSWSSSGELGIQIDEEVLRVAVAASHTPTTFGDSCEDTINQAQDGRLFCTAVNTTGRMVLTVFDVGVRGNQHQVKLDTSLLPSGMSVVADQQSDVVNSGGGPAITVAGTDTIDATYVLKISTGGTLGTAQYQLQVNGGAFSSAATLPTGAFALPGHTGITVTTVAGTYILNATYTWSGVAALSNGAIPFMGGAGTDDIEDALDANDSVTNDYNAVAHNDATNVGKVETHVSAKAAFDVGRLEQYVTGTNRTLTTAIALGQTGMNDQLGQCLWVQNGMEHPSRVSARMAALRSITEGAQPNTNYDDMVLPGAAPQLKESDVPNRSTLNSALSNSVTPLITVDGELQIVRAICSRSLSGSTPDYRTYDIGDVSVPIRIRKELVALGQALKDPNTGGMQWDGPDPEEGLAPAGIFTPNFWAAQVNAQLQEWESERFHWLQDVATNPAKAEWDPDAKRTMSDVPNVVRHQFHSLGIVVRQTAA